MAVFKPGKRQAPSAGQRTPGLLKLLLCGCLYVCLCVCVFVCVCMRVCPPLRLLITSGVMWHDMNPIPLVKQVLESLSLMGVALALIRVIATNPRGS